MITAAISADSALIPTWRGNARQYDALTFDTSSILVLELVCQAIDLRDRRPAFTQWLSVNRLVADTGWLVSVTVSAGYVGMHVTNYLCNPTMCRPLPLCIVPRAANRRSLQSSRTQRREDGISNPAVIDLGSSSF